MKDRSAYWRDYRHAHKDELKEYRLARKDKKREYDQRRYQANRQETVEHQRGYHVTHKGERKVYESQYMLGLKQQFMGAVYGQFCFFCGEKVAPEDLARHHINGDGREEREQLGGGTTGSVRSWKRAIVERNPKRWATTHMSCHTRFHHLKVKK